MSDVNDLTMTAPNVVTDMPASTRAVVRTRVGGELRDSIVSVRSRTNRHPVMGGDLVGITTRGGDEFPAREVVSIHTAPPALGAVDTDDACESCAAG